MFLKPFLNSAWSLQNEQKYKNNRTIKYLSILTSYSDCHCNSHFVSCLRAELDVDECNSIILVRADLDGFRKGLP